MKISVCVDAVFSKYDFIESMKSIKKVGLDTVEFWCWWEKNLDEIKACKDELNLKVSTFCTKFISLTDESKHTQYLEGLKESIEAAKYLDCNLLISQVGNDTGTSRKVQHENIVNGLKLCVDVLEKSNMMLVIEPLNTRVDHEGYYLSSSEEAFEIVRAVGSNNIKVLYDVYHQSVTKRNKPSEGELIPTISDNIDLIGHFHVAGSPGRHEIYTGDVDYTAIFKAIDATNYTGYVGFEYFPLTDAIISLKKTLKIND